ncbi:prion-inhibition and propagation-domain-containing protein [Aspergillus floccosus]
MTGVEIISAASGIAGLFTTTITWFDYIYVARKAAPRLQSLIVKLGSAQLRLTRWGQAVGLTGSDVEDEESLKSSGVFQLDEEQENQAIRTFRVLVALFEESKKICHKERKGKSEDNPEVKANEIKPFGQDGFKWSAMHHYLHETMQKIVHERRNKMSVPRLFKFAIYDEKHLEKLVKDINDHIDALYQIYTPSASDEEEAGKQEMDKLLKVMKELRSASERDPVMNTAVKNILDQRNENMTFNTTESTVQKIGQDQQCHYEMTVGSDASKRR